MQVSIAIPATHPQMQARRVPRAPDHPHAPTTAPNSAITPSPVNFATCATSTLDLGTQYSEVGRQEALHILDIQRLRATREPGQVGEQDTTRLAAHAAPPRGCQRCRALLAELRSVGVLGRTCRAGDRHARQSTHHANHAPRGRRFGQASRRLRSHDRRHPLDVMHLGGQRAARSGSFSSRSRAKLAIESEAKPASLLLIVGTCLRYGSEMSHRQSGSARTSSRGSDRSRCWAPVLSSWAARTAAVARRIARFASLPELQETMLEAAASR